MKRFVPFVREVFAPGLHLLYAAFWVLALTGSLALASESPVRLDAVTFVAIATVFLVLLYLRFADEIKDAAYDARYNPDRPLVRGFVNAAQVRSAMVGVAVVALVLNLVLVPAYGWLPLAIVAADLAWGALLIPIERASARIRDGIFWNLLVTYPVNVALSVYTTVLFLLQTGGTPALPCALVLACFVVAFLHFEIARKTAWPALAAPDERLYSHRLGGKVSITLAFACAAAPVFTLIALFRPWQRGVGAWLGCLALLLPLYPALKGFLKFLRKRGERVALKGPGILFLVLFYLSFAAYTLSLASIDPGGLTRAAFLALLALCLIALPNFLRFEDRPVTPDRLASLFYIGAEHVMRGNSMNYRMRFKEPLDPARVYASYERFIKARESVRMKWVEYPETQSFGWEPFERDELVALLAKERQSLMGTVTQAQADSAYAPTNLRLPLRFSLVDSHTLVCTVNHAWATGLGALFYIRDWLRFYLADTLEPIDPPVEELVRPGRFARIGAGVLGVFWAVLFALSFFARVRKHTVAETVDLTRGTAPNAESRAGFTVRRFEFGREQTAHILAEAKRKKLSVGEAIGVVLVRTLFEAQPEKKRVLVSMPVDLGRYVPDLSRFKPGNQTGSVCVQFFRDRELEPQMRAAFRWLRRGTPYWLMRVFGFFAKSEFAVRDAFSAGAQQPFSQRGAYDNHSCAWSNPGRLETPDLFEQLENISGHAKTQTLLFTASTFQGVLTIETCFSNDLFDPARVLPIVDTLPARLGLGEAAAADEAPANAGPLSVQHA